MIELTLTLKMTTTQVVEMSVTVNNNSPVQDYVHLGDYTQPTYEMTPGFKPFTMKILLPSKAVCHLTVSISNIMFSFHLDKCENYFV